MGISGRWGLFVIHTTDLSASALTPIVLMLRFVISVSALVDPVVDHDTLTSSEHRCITTGSEACRVGANA